MSEGSPQYNFALPGNPRYQPKDLVGIFGYDNLYVPTARVELAGLDVMAEIGAIPASDFALLTDEARKSVLAIRTTIVDEVERRVTRHDIRALVRLIQEILPQPLRRWVHVPFTSYDPLDTGRILQFAQAHADVLRPRIREVTGILAVLARKYAGTLQIGRTHGQHALPITVGFWLATILGRLLYNGQRMDEFAGGLVGKISGAVGCNNAVEGLNIAKMCGGATFQDRVLTRLGLKPAPISTQILPPEPLAYFLYSCLMASAVFGQLGRDCRQLMRSEIAEVGEPFEAGQVGSSTMAQKRNPITFENLEGTWLRTKSEFGKVLDSLTSEHQRDLVGSSLMRDFPIILVNLCVQLDALLRRKEKGAPAFLERLTVNEANCRRNFDMSAGVILAEPMYIALQMAGYQGDAHELINREVVPMSLQRSQPLIQTVLELASINGVLRAAVDNIPHEVIDLLSAPERYTGDAAAQANKIADLAEVYCSAFTA